MQSYRQTPVVSLRHILQVYEKKRFAQYNTPPISGPLEKCFLMQPILSLCYSRAVRRLHILSAARRSILVDGSGAPPVQKNLRRWQGHGVIDFYSQVFQPKQPSHSHTLTLLLCYNFSCISIQNVVFPLNCTTLTMWLALHNISH